MLTALSITEKIEKNKLKHLFNIIRGNKITITLKQSGGVTLRRLQYFNRNGKINWDIIDEYVGIQRDGILCSEYLELPADMGYRRFASEEFSKRLCTNMALQILSKVQDASKLKVCFYDLYGESADTLIHILEYCPEVRVYTQNSELYSNIRDVILEDTGISPIISCDESILEDTDFLIAPCKIKNTLPLKNKAITLTSVCPDAGQKGALYFRYHFKMPTRFADIKPAELSDFYFATALYVKAKQHQLGTIVPMICSNYSSGARLESICAYFDSRA